MMACGRTGRRGHRGRSGGGNLTANRADANRIWPPDKNERGCPVREVIFFFVISLDKAKRSSKKPQRPNNSQTKGPQTADLGGTGQLVTDRRMAGGPQTGLLE